MDLSAAATQFTILAFAGLTIAAAASDWRRLMIPNSYSLALVALFPSFVIASGGDVDWVGSLIYAAAAFVVGFVLFTLRICGGGDVKLFAAVALWAGPTLFVPMLLYTSVSGAVMAVVLWIHYRFNRAALPTTLAYATSDTAISKQPMPYAVAIAAGGLFVAVQLLLGV